jgi:small-conductance mechanosensitive channel
VTSAPLGAWITLNLVSFGYVVAGQPHAWVGAAISLTLAWIVIRLVTLVIRSKFWSQVAFYTVWPIAALDVFGVLNDLIMYLDSASIPMGEDSSGIPRDLSAFDVVRAVLAFAVLFWLAHVIAGFLAKRIEEIEDLTPSLKALIVKVLNILFPVLAFFFALQYVGVNLAALAVFSGALGLGVGLGLQRSVSNLIAGFTLIADKSIKPGDVVSIDDTFGWVTHLGARYVGIRTRDGMEHLVPNDKFISEGVINWSHADKVVRLHAPFGVSYETKDLRQVRELCYEALDGIDRVVSIPKPQCNMMEYGDSSINFDLRFWITDPENGIANIRSEVYLAVHDKLAAHGIEIPFPQRDLHLRSISPDVAAALKGAGQE